MIKQYNFSAGPAILPQEVFEKCAQALIDFNHSGLSIAEISHRSPAFTDVIEEARLMVKSLMKIDNSYKVLFLHGGASMQFLSVAMNLLNQKADYINTGVWSEKAILEAQAFGQVRIAGSSADKHFRYIPKNIEIDPTADYVHLTSNNTIFGTQFHSFPQSPIPLVADMSSDIFSREIDFSRFGLIYAGTQKNLGFSGVALVVVKEDLLGKVHRTIPTLLDYQTHIKNKSLTNTPATVSIYSCLLTMQWIQKQGGLKTIEQKNQEKAEILYREIDRNALFSGYADKDDRSLMNAVFFLKDEKLKHHFDTLCQQANISGLNGHRVLGGYRASIYNAMPIDGVKTLIDVMQSFEKQYG